MSELDEIDIAILRILQENARISNTELAARIGMAPPTVLRRIKLLEERGYIKGYAAIVDPLPLGLTVTAFIFVETVIGCDLDETTDTLAAIPGVQEIHRVIGQWCFLLKVRTQTPQTLEVLLNRKLRNNPSVRSTHTTLVTSSPYETPILPLPKIEQEEPATKLA